MKRLELVGRVCFLPVGLVIGLAAGLMAGLVGGVIIGLREGWELTWSETYGLERPAPTQNRRKELRLHLVEVERKPAPLELVQ